MAIEINVFYCTAILALMGKLISPFQGGGGLHRTNEISFKGPPMSFNFQMSFNIKSVKFINQTPMTDVGGVAV